MDVSDRSLRASLEGWLQERADHQVAFLRGALDAIPFEALRRGHPMAGSWEALQLALERTSEASTDDQKMQARNLLRLVAQAVVEGVGAEVEEELGRAQTRGSVQLAEERLKVRTAVLLERREPARLRRSAISRALDDWQWSHSSLAARRWDAFARVAERGASRDPRGLHALLLAGDPNALVAEAETFLRVTEDAYRDLLGYVLRKVDSTLKPLPGGRAQLHDLAFAGSLPMAGVSLSAGELRFAVQRWLEQWGFSANSAGRIRWELEARDDQSIPPTLIPRRVPSELLGLATVRGGTTDLLDLLCLHGEALALAGGDASLPIEARFGMSTASLVGALFQNFAADPLWLRRVLELSPGVARELARAHAFFRLARLRQHCALLPHELSLLEHGPSRERADEYEERLRKALFLETRRGGYLAEASPFVSAETPLVAEAGASALLGRLQERFDEDCWRNPAARSLLSERMRFGDLDAPAHWIRQLGGEPSLTAAAERWVRRLAA